jgi:GNAT superfamily N-acetyltransferase
MMNQGLLPSLDLVRQTLAADIAYTISRMQVLERLPGNPLGIAYRWFDDRAVALMGRLPGFARVVGLDVGHEHHVEPLVDWYRAHDIKPSFELVPGMYDASLGRELARLGFCQSVFHASLIGTPTKAPAQIDRDIEPVTTAAAMEDYLDAYVAGWGIPAQHHAQFKANVRPWREQPGWSLYLARVDGRPAAAATLYVQGGVAYLADATTDPAFRGRGLHSALLRRRLHEAARAGAELVFSGAEPFSASHRNMERAGLRLQFMRAKWTVAT